MDALAGLAGVLLLIALLLSVAGAVVLRAYNTLQRAAQEVKEKASNVRLGIERRLGADERQRQREAYNAAVRAYNTHCLALPTALVARALRFAHVPYLDAEPADAVADLHEPAYFYMSPGGVPQGPARAVALRAMLAEGRLPPDTLAARVGTDDWQHVARIVGPEAVVLGLRHAARAPPP